MSQLARPKPVKERPLQVDDRPIHGALTPARRPGKSILSGTAEGDTVRRGSGKAGDQLVKIKIIVDKHKRSHIAMADTQCAVRLSCGESRLCTQVSRQQIGVLLLMFKAQRKVRLRRDAVELI